MREVQIQGLTLKEVIDSSNRLLDNCIKPRQKKINTSNEIATAFDSQYPSVGGDFPFSTRKNSIYSRNRVVICRDRFIAHRAHADFSYGCHEMIR